MKARILYHPLSEHARAIEQYARDFERQKRHKIELVSLETREGAEMAQLYGIMRYPAILVSQDDGQLMKYWDQEYLPLMDEVSGHL